MNFRTCRRTSAVLCAESDSLVITPISLNTCQNLFPPDPRFVARFLVSLPLLEGFLIIGGGFVVSFLVACRFWSGRLRCIAGAHETVSRSFVRHLIKSLLQLSHCRGGRGKRGVDARIVAGVKAVNRSFDARERGFIRLPFSGPLRSYRRRRSVENKTGFDVRVVGGVAECLTAAPTISGYDDFAIRCRQLRNVI